MTKTIRLCVHRKSESSVFNECVLWGSKVLVPTKGRDIIIQQLHKAHPRVARIEALSYGFFWWPEIDSQIEDCVRNCPPCQEHQLLHHRLPLHPWEWPHWLWAWVHMDHTGPFIGQHVLDTH